MPETDPTFWETPQNQSEVSSGTATRDNRDPIKTLGGVRSCTGSRRRKRGAALVIGVGKSKKRFFHKKSSKNCPSGEADDILFVNGNGA